MAKSSKNNALIRARGFSMFELITVVVILGILAAMLGPAMSRIIRHNRVNPSNRSYQFVDRKTGAVLRIRTFYGDTSEYRLTSLVFTPSTIDVFPNGVSSAAVVIDLANGDYAKQITASTAGFIRVKR
jgi:prepilin-type N-terminal cleavage/methylation domain-containing protein